MYSSLFTLFFFFFLFQSEECLSQEEACLRHCRARLDHIKEHADERKSAVVLWKKKRLDRMLVDHCLRSGFYETAIKLARDSQIEVECFFHETTFEAHGPSGGHLHYVSQVAIA